MNEYNQSYPAVPVAQLDVNDRAAFINRTYLHLAGAIGLFTLIEILIFKSGLAEGIARAMLGTSWLLVLGGFVVVSWLASYAAARVESKAGQYGALLLYVLAQAIIFVPLLWAADHYAPGVITSAAAVTLLGFSTLTAIVFFTRKDFSFLRTFVIWAGILAFGAIVGAVLFNFQLGTWFSVGMIVVAGASILYNTSTIMQSYPEDRYVSAALQLFASVALLFWYVLRLFMRSR